MKETGRRVNIMQIAEAAGVSIATVSRVINGTARVAQDKRERVEAAIARYEFSPSAMARGLASDRSMTLGIVLPDITNPYFAELFLEMERNALAAGYAVLLCNTLFGGSARGNGQAMEEAEAFAMMLGKQVDGVVVTGGQLDLEDVSEDYLQALARLARAIPVVVIGRPVPAEGCQFLERDSIARMTLAMQHLIGLGHRRIAFVGGQAGVTVTRGRLDTWRRVLATEGLEAGDELIALSDFYTEDGHAAMSTLLARQTVFTAFVAMNDRVALGAARALADKGIRMPEDVAFVSCDSFPDAAFQIPRITGIERQDASLGREAINRLLAAIHGEPQVASSQEKDQHVSLRVRESCGAHLGIRSFS